VTGSAPSKAVVAACVDALDKIGGLGNPLLDGASVEDGIVQFTVRLEITSSALSGRYQAKSNNEPGEN
jgi:hypothetical protein